MTDILLIIEKQKELASMPEHVVLQKVWSLDQSFDIFHGNYLELKKQLDLHTNMPDALLMWDVKNKHVLIMSQKEASRLLHNYVASAMSLIEHTRKLYKELYEPDDIFPEYKDKIQSHFKSNNLASFVICLRVYCQHYKSAPIISTMSYSAEEPVLKARLKINKYELEKYSGWKAHAKKFLRQQQDSIDLLKVVDDYYELVMDFRTWFTDNQKRIHAEDFEKLSQKQKELAQLVIPYLLQPIQTIKEESSDPNLSPDDIFVPMLSQKEWSQLVQSPPNSSERCEMLISFLENKADLSDEHKNQIRGLYCIDT